MKIFKNIFNFITKKKPNISETFEVLRIITKKKRINLFRFQENS